MFLVQKYVRISRPPGASGICPLTGARVPLTHPERPGMQCGAAIDAPARPCLMQHGRAYKNTRPHGFLRCRAARLVCWVYYSARRTPGRFQSTSPRWRTTLGSTLRLEEYHISIHVLQTEDDSERKMVRRHFTIPLYYGFRDLLSRFFLRVCSLPAGVYQAAGRLPPEISNDIADDHIHQNDGKNTFHFCLLWLVKPRICDTLKAEGRAFRPRPSAG